MTKVNTPTIAPTLKSLNARPLPQWFDDAKFGIFIHWGMFAIPAYAETNNNIYETFRNEYDTAVARTPYSEWYANAIKVPGTPAFEHHQKVHKGAPYSSFKQPFVDGLEQWDPADWAAKFKQSGAQYVVLVTKHHDGFCLWPSDVKNPHADDWFTQRDIVGELAGAVRAQGMRFGIYYSGGIDWTFNPEPLKTFGDFMGSMPHGEYEKYATAQVRELMERYEPSILWNDISWPTNQGSLFKLFADFYNAVPDGVVNDRWVHASWYMKLLRRKPVRRLVDWMIKRSLKNSEKEGGIIPPVIPHSDFRTPEYTSFDKIQKKKWEATRGMSHSFGFNQNDTLDDYETPEKLLLGLIDAVSKNGNLLLNVGPRGVDGSIPEPQLYRLAFFGDWLSTNGEAIYGAQPWHKAEAKTVCGLEVRFTVKGDYLNVIVIGTPASEEIQLLDTVIDAVNGETLGGAPVVLDQQEKTCCLRVAKSFAEGPAHTMKFKLNS
ncbi:MAG: alpha-L-fucosidase [Parvibaculaceae bacterium]|nr:alpha-L-fucosidase [Parvibaculaceae bacterium]